MRDVLRCDPAICSICGESCSDGNSSHHALHQSKRCGGKFDSFDQGASRATHNQNEVRLVTTERGRIRQLRCRPPTSRQRGDVAKKLDRPTESGHWRNKSKYPHCGFYRCINKEMEDGIPSNRICFALIAHRIFRETFVFVQYCFTFLEAGIISEYPRAEGSCPVTSPFHQRGSEPCLLQLLSVILPRLLVCTSARRRSRACDPR